MHVHICGCLFSEMSSDSLCILRKNGIYYNGLILHYNELMHFHNGLIFYYNKLIFCVRISAA